MLLVTLWTVLLILMSHNVFLILVKFSFLLLLILWYLFRYSLLESLIIGVGIFFEVLLEITFTQIWFPLNIRISIRRIFFVLLIIITVFISVSFSVFCLRCKVSIGLIRLSQFYISFWIFVRLLVRTRIIMNKFFTKFFELHVIDVYLMTSIKMKRSLIFIYFIVLLSEPNFSKLRI